MSLELCYLANGIVVSRLIFTFSDEPLSRKQTVVMALLQVVALVAYEVSYTLAILAAVLVLVNVLLHLFEKRLDRTTEPRLISLLVQMIVLSIFFSPGIDLSFNPGLLDLLQSLRPYSVLIDIALDADWLELGIVWLGLLLVSNETNMLVRYPFSLLGLEPKSDGEMDKMLIITAVDERGYNAGRIIGILERILVYFFVLNAQFAAIGLVLAAKSFTRFKELEKREYAEYVLIGTLLSTLLAVMVAVVVLSLLSILP